MSRPFIVLVRSGRRVGQKAVLLPGSTLRVGRAAPCELTIPDDRDLSDIHFALTAESDSLRLEDRGSVTGTDVNGQRVQSADIAHGDWVRAGATDFSIYREGHTPPLDDVVITPEKKAILAALTRAAGATPSPDATAPGTNRPLRLYALLDAARDERVLQLVRESTEEARSLYDGLAGDAMAEGAPYLVDVGTGALLEKIVFEGWGKSWGVFVTSTRPFVEVRRHFRRFLIVQDDETEERLYFRFYDPRVLRVFVPTCTKRQTAELFGELTELLMEDERGQLVRFSKGAKPVVATEGASDGRA